MIDDILIPIMIGYSSPLVLLDLILVDAVDKGFVLEAIWSMTVAVNGDVIMHRRF